MKYNFLLLITSSLILQSCGGTSPSLSDNILKQFNSACKTDYTTSFQTELYVNSTFNLIEEITENNQSVDLEFNHKFVDSSIMSSESISLTPCNEDSKAIAESDKLKTKTAYQPNQIIYHYYNDPGLAKTTRDTAMTVKDLASYLATKYLSGYSITTENNTYHYKTYTDPLTAKNYISIHKNITDEILNQIPLDENDIGSYNEFNK